MSQPRNLNDINERVQEGFDEGTIVPAFQEFIAGSGWVGVFRLAADSVRAELSTASPDEISNPVMTSDLRNSRVNFDKIKLAIRTVARGL